MSNPILITGVGKRIGYHLTKHFVRNDIPVIGTYRTKHASIEELSNLGVDLYHVDFYEQTSFNQFIEHIKNQYQSLRALIHNASDWLPESSNLELQDIFYKMMTIHAKVPYQLNLALYELLQNNSKTVTDIIHFTDYVAEKGSKKHIAYAASKAALENLTLSFASLLSPTTKVNSIAPALIKFNSDDKESYKAKALSKALLPYEGGYHSVIETVDFIMQSKYITGRSFALDGGRHLK